MTGAADKAIRLVTHEGDGEPLEYRLRHTRRRTVGLYVHADGRVEVRAPQGCDRDYIHRFVLARLDWIRRKQTEFASRPRGRVPEYRDGELHSYLGRAYPLVLTWAARPRIRLAESRIRIEAPDVNEPDQVARRLADWYRQQAHELFPERLALGEVAMRDYRIPSPTLKIRSMKTRWGSCSRRGSITLNLELIRYPLPCLDYVIAHELCHLLEFNHGPGFYRLMDAVMPDWREHRARLRNDAPTRDID